MPTAPLLNTTVLLAPEFEVSKSKPRMVIELEFAARLLALCSTTGATVATCTAEPLLTPLVVTVAVRLPTALGIVEIDTVSAVAVAFVTVPTAPLLKATVLLAAVVLKPLPLIVSVAAFAARLAVLAVTAGAILATSTDEPLAPSVVTTAIKGAVAAGGVLKVTVSEVGVAAVTLPTGVVVPSLKVTVSLAAVGSKPWPAIVSVVEPAARLDVLLVTTGEGVATCTGALLAPSVVTTAVSGPALVGGVDKDDREQVRAGRGDALDTTAPLLEDDRVVARRWYQSRNR